MDHSWQLLVLLASMLSVTLALNNGLALTPPMGWMSGQRFGCQVDCVNYPDDCISERLIKSTVDVMARKYLPLGYNYVVIDDCWMDRNRDSSGRLQADLRRFPSGIVDLISYIHSRNLKIGLYLDVSNVTCGGFPGSQNYLALDAQTLAGWQVDMVKVGACGVFQNVSVLNSAYPELGRQLNLTGRPILYMCEWPLSLSSRGMQPNYNNIMQTCNQYRTFQDIGDDWQSILNEIQYFAGYNYLFVNYSGPGSYSDPDQLVIGDFGLSFDQSRFQMALWAILSAPLFISADLRFMKTESESILLNRGAILIDQDPLGILGSQINVNGQVTIWRKAILPTGSYALAIFYTNISGGPAKVSILLSDLGLTAAPQYNITEVLTGRSLGVYKPWFMLNVEVNPTGALLIQAVAQQMRYSYTINDLP